jgi:hypothetical protein
MLKWSGWIFVVLGAVHTVLSLAMVVADHAGSWFTGGLWQSEGGFLDMTDGMSSYWFSLASFGVPLFAIGLTILWLLRRGITPPAFLGWTLLAWALVNLVVLLLSPWILGVVAAVLYLAGVRRARLSSRASDGSAALLETSR